MCKLTVSLGVFEFDWWDGQKTICPTVISPSVMSGMKEIKMAEQSVVRFMSLDLSIVEDVDAYKWLSHTVSADVVYRKFLVKYVFFTYNESTAYLFTEVDNIVSPPFIHIAWYLRHHWCIFWMEPVQLVVIVFLHFPLTHNRPYLPQLSLTDIQLSFLQIYLLSSKWLQHCQFSLQFSLVLVQHFLWINGICGMRRINDYFITFVYFLLPKGERGKGRLKSTPGEAGHPSLVRMHYKNWISDSKMVAIYSNESCSPSAYAKNFFFSFHVVRPTAHAHRLYLRQHHIQKN